jgi:hypothetical protein
MPKAIPPLNIETYVKIFDSYLDNSGAFHTFSGDRKHAPSIAYASPKGSVHSFASIQQGGNAWTHEVGKLKHYTVGDFFESIFQSTNNENLPDVIFMNEWQLTYLRDFIYEKGTGYVLPITEKNFSSWEQKGRKSIALFHDVRNDDDLVLETSAFKNLDVNKDCLYHSFDMLGVDTTKFPETYSTDVLRMSNQSFEDGNYLTLLVLWRILTLVKTMRFLWNRSHQSGYSLLMHSG